MPIDNSELVASFLPRKDDHDTFYVTELLDRAHNKGSNRLRMVRWFHSRTVEHFWTQWPHIVKLSEAAQVRAYTRLAPRSYRRVGMHFARRVVDLALEGQWAALPHLYASAVGAAPPKEKLWLFDVDPPSEELETGAFRAVLDRLGAYVVSVPSRKGVHYVARPFDLKATLALPEGVTLHRDNAVNLYIPDGAA